MAVYVELQEDPFDKSFDVEADESKKLELNPRRPLRGIQLRKDTVAYITIINKFGKTLPLVDAGGESREKDGKGESSRYTNFLVQGYSVQRKEKQQLIQTFGEDYVFFFGEQPKIYQIQGVLMHTADFNWRNEFLYNYDKYLRGTKLAEQDARAYIFQGGLLWEGYLMAFSYQENSAQPYSVNFTIQMLVTNETVVDDVGETAFPFSDHQGYTTQPWAYQALLQGYERNRNTIPQRTNFTEDLANFILTGSSEVTQNFVRDTSLRGKIRDNVDEYLGGAALKAHISPAELIKARRKLAIREALYLWREQYLRARFIMDSARRLSRGEQTATAKVFGVMFTINSLRDAVMQSAGVD